MTTLSQRLDDYLAVRRSLGFELSFEERMLRVFTGFADREETDHITVDLFLLAPVIVTASIGPGSTFSMLSDQSLPIELAECSAMPSTPANGPSPTVLERPDGKPDFLLRGGSDRASELQRDRDRQTRGNRQQGLHARYQSTS